MLLRPGEARGCRWYRKFKSYRPRHYIHRRSNYAFVVEANPSACPVRFEFGYRREGFGFEIHRRVKPSEAAFPFPRTQWGCFSNSTFLGIEFMLVVHVGRMQLTIKS